MVQQFGHNAQRGRGGRAMSLGAQGSRFSSSPHRYAPRSGGYSHYSTIRDGNRGNFHGRAGSGRTKHNGFGSYIDPSRFVNKAVSVSKADAFTPVHRFEDFPIAEGLKRAIITKGLTIPTPIQDQAIPHMLEGKDVVGIADTGTGKTAAFLIPLINSMLSDSRARALVMVPTRELAIQIERELFSISRGLNIFSACCVGGSNIALQIRSLRRDPHFIIGTPGRLKDLIERRVLDLSCVSAVVLDEADRMLDMGFIKDMRAILALMPAKRHSLCFSATMSPEIERLVGDFLKQPVRIFVKTRETSRDVDQDVVRIAAGENKLTVLHTLLGQREFDKVLVFGRTKHGVEKLSRMLEQSGHKADSIHGNKTQRNREQALRRFRSGETRILVATDVAARGLDIPGISHVINFDLPATHDDYIHRIGRTGRAGARGKALTFIE